LGATGQNNELADWMARVLRGRNLLLEPSIGAIRDAIHREVPRHLARLPGPGAVAHYLLAPAFVGTEARQYTVDVLLSADRKRYRTNFQKQVGILPGTGAQVATRIVLTGDVTPQFLSNRHWVRPLLRLIKSCDAGRCPPGAVAQHLASVCYQYHLTRPAGSVGPRSIVGWRFRRQGRFKGGGGHLAFTGLQRDTNNPPLPSIGNGMDIGALVNVFMQHVQDLYKRNQTIEHIDSTAIDEALRKLPDSPDEKLS
ncbi:MAG TPA: hypothetical protein VG692_08950, partial [Gemmatimonadales bacterium]|nr:hypothetical protein [Gemmatimonadales bacterium]